MSFLVFPPEINSALMHAGAGTTSLLDAAVAWNGLAAELTSAAESFTAVTSGLAGGSWQGASAAAMAAAATPYAGWLSAAAASAESTAVHARGVVGAFEAALAATVDPLVVAANRSDLVSLALSNIFGQNTPAIAAAEWDYEVMWAQDVAAMAGYHLDASAVVSALQAFTQPARTLAAAGEQFVVNLGFANLGAYNVGDGNIGTGNFGFANIGSGNVGFGNAALAGLLGGNIGFGNTGSGNFGFGNTGSGNFGFGNSGTGNRGIGLIGDNQVGFGGFNSGSGNIGLFNSGTGNVGFFNSGTGNQGLFNGGENNLGFGNSGRASTGLFNAGSLNVGALNPGNYNTGLWNTENGNSGLANFPRGAAGFPIQLPLDLVINDGGIGPISIQPIHILPTIPLNFNHTFMLGPLTIPDIHVPAIPLAGIEIPITLGPLSISPITLLPPFTIPTHAINIPGMSFGPTQVVIPQLTSKSFPTTGSGSSTLIGPIHLTPNINPITLNVGLTTPAVTLFPAGVSIPDQPLQLTLGFKAATEAFTIPGFSLPEHPIPLTINLAGQIDAFSTPAITIDQIPVRLHAVVSAGQPVPLFPPTLPVHIDMTGTVGAVNVHPIAIPAAHVSITNASVSIGSFTIPQVTIPHIPISVNGYLGLSDTTISDLKILDRLNFAGQFSISPISGPSLKIDQFKIQPNDTSSIFTFIPNITNINIAPKISFGGTELFNLTTLEVAIPNINIPAQSLVNLDLLGGFDPITLFAGGVTFPTNSVSLQNFSAGTSSFNLFPNGFKVDQFPFDFHTTVFTSPSNTHGSIGPIHIPGVPALPSFHVGVTGNVNLNLGVPPIPLPTINMGFGGFTNYGVHLDAITIPSFGTTGTLVTNQIGIELPISGTYLSIFWDLRSSTPAINFTIGGPLDAFSINQSIPAMNVPLNFTTGNITFPPLSLTGSIPMDINLPILSASTWPGITHLQNIPINFSLDTPVFNIPDTTIPVIPLTGTTSLASGGLSSGLLNAVVDGIVNPGPRLSTMANAGVAWIGEQLSNAGVGNEGLFNLGNGNLGNLNVGGGNIGSYNFGWANVGSGNIGLGNSGFEALLGQNLGFGNSGSGNIGFGNTGSGNIGFGNTGNGNTGIGLIGDNRSGFGGWNSGSGNVGLFNSGSGNWGLFNSGNNNSGIGNSGQANTGLFNAGIFNTGLGNAGTHNSGLLNAGIANSGAFNPGDFNTGLFNSGDANRGFANSGDGNNGVWISGDHSTGFLNTGDFQGPLGSGLAGMNLFDIWTNLGPIHIDPIHFPGVPINLNETLNIGPFTIPEITVPAISLDMHQSLTLPAITLFQGLNMPAQTLVIPLDSPGGSASSLTLPVLHWTMETVGVPSHYTIGALNGYNLPNTGITIHFGASSGRTGSAEIHLPAINIPAIATLPIPLSFDVTGGTPEFSFFPGGLSIPENPIPVNFGLSGGLQPFTLFPNGYTIDPINLHLRLDADLLNPIDGRVVDFHLAGGMEPVNIPAIPIPDIQLGLNAHLNHGAFTIPSIPIPNVPVQIDGGISLGPIGIPSIHIPAITNTPLATIHFGQSTSGAMEISPFVIWAPGNSPWDFAGATSQIYFGSNWTGGLANAPLPLGNLIFGGSTSEPWSATINGGLHAFNTPAIMIDKIPFGFTVPGGLDGATLFPGGLNFPSNSLLGLNLTAGTGAFTIPAVSIPGIPVDVHALVSIASGGRLLPPYNLLFVHVTGGVGPIVFPSFHIPSIPLGFNLGGGIGPIHIPSFSTPPIHFGLEPTATGGPITIHPFSLPQLGLDIGATVSDMKSGLSTSNFGLRLSGAIGFGIFHATTQQLGGTGSSTMQGFSVGPFTLITPPGGGIPGMRFPLDPISIGMPLSVTIPSLTFPGLDIPHIPIGLGLSGALPAFDLPSITIDRIPINLAGPLTLF